MFDYSPLFVFLIIMIPLIVYFIMEEQAFREREEEEFEKRTVEAFDRCEESDEEYSIEEFLEEMEKW